MIKLFRIDERLVHGQVVIKWSRHTSVDHIVVANDAAAANSIIQKSLMMAAPIGIKLTIKTIVDSIKTLNDPRCANMKLLILVNSPKDAIEIVKNVPGIPFINVGNYGRIAPAKLGMPRTCYDQNLYCDLEEVNEFKILLETGLKCVYQTTPEEVARNLGDIFK